ncbi:MAG: N-acetylmuramoyl-L-alanine amidase [Anaerolineae bacterium]|nr:N-acetylmuramoyl-L-alanine amidase [Anaerolineae bacterium]
MRKQTIHLARRFLLLIIIVAIGLAGIVVWQQASGSAGALLPAPLWRPLLPLAGRQIGIVAGHHGNDAGAVCPDGLTEAQVNMAVAEAVVKELQARGAAVDLLAEFDERLAGYRADAFVSIHTDSCAVELSGYKVASLATNAPAANGESGRLADCLWRAYGEATGLAPHPNTITYDMSRYHAFREIAPTTPAAIIEIGFLKADRELLTRRPERAAAGIVAGIVCFLGHEAFRG